MLYRLLKIPARMALPFHCRHIQINRPSMLQLRGPLLLACNHPNSFLDAIILASLFDEPVYSLARGDAFSNKWNAMLLRQLNILPVYRQREGASHLYKNYATFDACQEIFKQNGIVLIFSEALCENEWKLRPLRKGTARLAATAWEQNIPLKVLPVGINYSSFKLMGKNIHLNFGVPIEPEQNNVTKDSARLLSSITTGIEQQLQELVYDIDKADKKKQQEIFTVALPGIRRTILFIPALLGAALHFPLYFPVMKLVQSKAFHSVHYDSIMVGMLFFLYPAYLILLCLLTCLIFGGYWWMLVLFILPFCAWSYIQLKKQVG